MAGETIIDQKEQSPSPGEKATGSNRAVGRKCPGYLFGDHIPTVGESTRGMGVARPVAPVRTALDEEAIFAITGDATVPEALVATQGTG